MKDWRIITVLLLCLVLASSTACNPFGGSSKEKANQQLVEVVRGDLTISVSGAGNIAVANEARLTFDTSGKVDKIYIKEGDKVSEGDELAKLDTDALELALAQSQVTYLQAKVTIDQAQVAVDQARATRDQAQATRDQAEATQDQAKAALEQAEYDLDQDEQKDPPDKDKIDVDELEVKAAESQLKACESNLVAAESLLAAAELQVEIAELQVGVAEPQLVVAEQGVTLAQKQLDEATITAPFDGTVASIGVDEGDTVSATTTIVHLIDLNSMELTVEVDEIDIPSVRQEQKAVIDVDALPELQLKGKVTSISLLPKVEAGVVVYEVKIGLDATQELGLKVGMSATADIIIDERNNVLLVPNRAIRLDSQGNTVVDLMVDEQIEERPVVTGISDGFQTEIIDGLKEGESVVRKAS